MVKGERGVSKYIGFYRGKTQKTPKRIYRLEKMAGEPANSEDYLFVSGRSPKMSLSAIQKRFKCWVGGYKPFEILYSIHSARHTYGTMLYRNTKDLRMVQKQLGHSSCQVTEVYADVLREDTAKAVNGLYENNV